MGAGSEVVKISKVVRFFQKILGKPHGSSGANSSGGLNSSGTFSNYFGAGAGRASTPAKLSTPAKISRLFWSRRAYGVQDF